MIVDIISYMKATRVQREVEEARESHESLDKRLDAIEKGNVVVVQSRQDLPTPSGDGGLYVVLSDDTNQGDPALYTFKSGAFIRVDGDWVEKDEENGAIRINGIKVVVYTHPPTHSADILVDGENKKAFTAQERAKLQSIEEGAQANDEDFGFTDVVYYIDRDSQGRITSIVLVDNYVPQNIKEPVDSLPPFPSGYIEGDTFYVRSEDKVYRHNGSGFVEYPQLLNAKYEYAENGKIKKKTVVDLTLVTPVTKVIEYFYDHNGRVIGKIVR